MLNRTTKAHIIAFMYLAGYSREIRNEIMSEGLAVPKPTAKIRARAPDIVAEVVMTKHGAYFSRFEY